MAKQKAVRKKAKVKQVKEKEVKNKIRDAKIRRLNEVILTLRPLMPTQIEIATGGALNQEKVFQFGKNPEVHLLIREFQGLVKDLYPDKNYTLENIRPPSTVEFK
jgi:hypothetical protein